MEISGVICVFVQLVQFFCLVFWSEKLLESLLLLVRCK